MIHAEGLNRKHSFKDGNHRHRFHHPLTSGAIQDCPRDTRQTRLRFDLAIRVGELQDSTLISKYLGSDNAMMLASSSYLKKHSTPKRITDLEGHRFLTLTGSPHTDQWVLVGPRKRQKVVPVHPHATVNDLSMIRRMALDGAGITLLPSYMEEQLADFRKLQRVLPEWRSPPFHYHAIYQSRIGVALKVRAWLNFFANKFEKSSSTNQA